MATHPQSAQVSTAVEAIQQRKLFQPQVAIILGSGLGALAEQVEHATSISYGEIPYFSPVHAAGHAGQLVLGFLAGMPVVLMQGRCHRYEGWTDAQVTFPVRCLHALGAQTLFVTNAAGGLNPRFQAGDLMVMDSHIDLLFSRPSADLSRYDCPTTDVPQRGASPYDYGLIQRACSIARRQDTVLHQGCYLATLGPTYETRAEYSMFRKIGADAVGMSTVPEVLTARRLGMQVLGCSVITNVASTDVPQSTSHQEVVDLGNRAGPRLMRILREILEDWAGQPD